MQKAYQILLVSNYVFISVWLLYVNVIYWYSEFGMFREKSQPADRLSWLKDFVVFLSPSRQNSR
jgi:hypothetical protein